MENGARFMTSPSLFVAVVGSQAGSFIAIFLVAISIRTVTATAVASSAAGTTRMMAVVGVLQGANFKLGPGFQR